MRDHSETPEASNGPKYRRIYFALRHALASGKYAPGDKLPSENELVASFGASRPTVRRALAQLDSEGLVDRRMGSGTVVSLRHQQNKFSFGLLIPELGITEIFEPICQGISQAQAGAPHELLWGPTFVPGGKAAPAQQLCDYYLERKVAGVFFAPMEFSAGKDEVNVAVARALEDARIPLVLLDRDIYTYPKRSRYDLVGIDNRRAGYMLTEHLLTTGSRRIGFFARRFAAPTVNARIAGYREALFTHLGVAGDELMERGDPSDLPTVEGFLQRCRPDAVICANDYTAAQFMATLNTLGIHVPSQIRVAGMDDVKYARLLQVPLTTIHQPCLQIGAAALFAMLDRIAHPEAPSRDFLVDFQLVVRRSTDVASPDPEQPAPTHTREARRRPSEAQGSSAAALPAETSDAAFRGQSPLVE